MKKLLYICLLMPLVVFQSCKKGYSPGDNYDFSNSLPPYVALKSTSAISVKLNADKTTAGVATVPIITRTALEQAVTVTYSVSGAITLTNQTVVLAKETTTVNATVPVPAKTAPGTAVFTINKAVAADGTVLTLGADNVAANQKVNIVITQL